MAQMTTRQVLDRALNEGKGVFRLAPAWVPRTFCRPGRRLRLHPDDYYALGMARGGIDERWIASTTHADNGPGTPEDEGMSYVVDSDGNRALLAEAVETFKGDLIGEDLYQKYGIWPVLAKFFDNLGPLPHHVHHNEEDAARIHSRAKPEMYFFPSQMNPHMGEFPYTFFGLNPGTTREQLREALENFRKGDNQITALAHAFRLVLDTGWDIPTGILHAPGSLLTYEPQFSSDVFSMFESVRPGEHVVGEDLLWRGLPEEDHGNFDALIDLLDWDKNVDPDFYRNRFMPPRPVRPMAEMEANGCVEEWIGYRCPVAAAKRLTVLPGHAFTWTEPVAFGVIAIQGHGTIGEHAVESPLQIRFGQVANDEFFVSAPAATAGVRIQNPSPSEPLVLLCHTSEHPTRPH